MTKTNDGAVSTKTRRKASAPKAARAKAPVLAVVPSLMDPAERQRRIELEAYFLAERRGFAPEGAASDWLAAERLVDGAI